METVLDKHELRSMISVMQREGITLAQVGEELNYRERAGVKDGHAGWDDNFYDYSTEELSFVEQVWSETEKAEEKFLVAIESTEDYSSPEFHSRLVDLDVQNADGSYGRMVDYYRIVHIGEAGGIVRLDERVFESAKDAREAVQGDERLELVSYDDLVHEAVWQMQHGKPRGTIESVLSNATQQSCAALGERISVQDKECFYR